MSYRVDEKTGNYVRTVTCGHCYEQGHNQSSCKMRKEKLANTIAEYERKVAENNFDDDWDRRHTERWLENNKEQLKKINNRGKNRKCSYCSEVGHTRRTCKYKKGDMNDFAVKTLEAREKFVDKFVEHGLGVGTLVMAKNWNEESLAMIKEIRWNNLTHETALGANNEYIDLLVSETFAGRRCGSMLPRAIADIRDISKDNHGRRESSITIVSPVDVSYPEDLLTMEGCLYAAKVYGVFEKERPYSYHGIDYDDE